LFLPSGGETKKYHHRFWGEEDSNERGIKAFRASDAHTKNIFPFISPPFQRQNKKKEGSKNVYQRKLNFGVKI
jgi:hypothetical protein